MTIFCPPRSSEIRLGRKWRWEYRAGMKTERPQNSQLPKKKPPTAIVLVILSAIIIYAVAYFSLVSVKFTNPDEHGINFYANAHYKVGSFPQIIARVLFKPLQFCDAQLFRPELWQDNKEKRIDAAITEWSTNFDDTKSSTNATPPK
jgi:hypothetical protein